MCGPGIYWRELLDSAFDDSKAGISRDSMVVRLGTQIQRK